MDEPRTSHFPEGTVHVTPTAQFNMLLEVRDEVKHLTSVLDPAITNLREDLTEARKVGDDARAEVQRKFDAYDIRLLTLDRTRWTVLGVAVVLGSIGGAVISIAASLFLGG